MNSPLQKLLEEHEEQGHMELQLMKHQSVCVHQTITEIMIERPFLLRVYKKVVFPMMSQEDS